MGKEKANKQAKANAIKDTTKSTENVPQSASGSGILQDARFQHLVSDPRFKSIPKVQRKVKIDKRFQGMFNDDKFKVKYTVDKYGRRVNKSNVEDLRKYYEMDSDTSEEDDEDAGEREEQERRKEEKAISRDADKSGESSSGEAAEPDENDALVSDGEEVPVPLRERLLDPQIDYARGEGRLVTDSSSDEESSDDDDPELLIDHVWGELDVQAETTDESTKRLAVCNMDWDRIRAVDLMVLFSSFLPRGGTILSVKIYTSEFGKERLAEEEVHGPTELVGLGKHVKDKSKSKKSQAQSVGEESSDSDSEEELVQEQDSDAGEGDDYHMEKLREYQLNRLRYYYAVVECDNIATADKIYKECDGIEYESSATKVDLRFIPDDTSFDEDEPTDVCTELPDTNSYKPRQFTTTALQQAKVDLTWDETALERRELGDRLASGKLDEVSDKDIRKMVAYSSEEDDEEDDDEEKEEVEAKVNETSKPSEAKPADKPKKGKKKKEDVISKYKALLEEINEKEQKEKNKKYEMELTWEIDDTKADKDEKDIDPKSKTQPELTPIDKVLQKRSEKNKKRKEERKKKKLQSMGIDPDAQNSGDDSDNIPDGVDMNDPYFAEEFANGDFADPKAKQAEKAKRQKKAQVTKEQEEEDERRAKELQLLLDDDDVEDQEKQHFSLDKILKAEQETKSKRKRRKQLKKSKAAKGEVSKEPVDNFQVNINDDRFNAVYSSHLFNIDPTDSHFKKTKAMEQIIQEKLKRRHGGESANETRNAEQAEPKKPKKQLENRLLVNSLKRKIQMKQQK